ncbi:MAG: hypothetical protein H5T69_18895 [Chloroflexi bacterium]|nr:hypothetical protein [Chloroflexota bacterium]
MERLLASGRYEALQQSQEVALLENRGARPYVQAYTRFLPFAPAPDEDLFALLPRALAQGYALVEWPGATPDQDVLRRAADLPSALPPAPQPNVEWRYSRPHADQIVIEYRADQPFLLMVSETWYPHWHVTVNGREHPLLLVNANFLGVWIQEPVGTISFHYRLPWYTWFGYIISAITAMTIVGLNVWPRLRRPVGG